MTAATSRETRAASARAVLVVLATRQALAQVVGGGLGACRIDVLGGQAAAYSLTTCARAGASVPRPAFVRACSPPVRQRAAQAAQAAAIQRFKSFPISYNLTFPRKLFLQ
jgi:hypothetical protein